MVAAMLWVRVGVAGAAVCALVAGCSSPQPQAQTETQVQPTTANAVAPSTPAKVDQLTGNENAVTFDFIYPDGDPHWTDEAKASLLDAANALVADFVPPKPVTITYKLADDNNPDNLAQATSALVDQETPGYFRTVVQQKLITGEDANGDQPDGDIDINWKADWALGDDVTPDQADFKAVIMHEMGHTLGFDTNIQGPGSAPVTNHPIFDKFVVNAEGEKVINDDFTFNTAFEPNLTGGNGGLFFGGPHAMAAYDGKPVPLFTDPVWSVSNVTHLDGRTFTGENKKIMNSGNELGDGPEVHELSPVELGIFEDLGYTVVQH
ncbi:matrixin family metalloprotease [Mycobacterium sp. RTGN5]|uniref:matrixin family metalloprotease n=1 Tax=Mycobacterium sp. RTGN5 TaxID=3016522 RepID=UPI0029C6F670|nr:matrixin family metalloprotease [Mycobacterium sp. RTGN5]